MFTRIIAVLIAVAALVGADEEMRSATPEECYNHSYGKELNWVTKLSVQFRLSLLNRQMPYVDDQYFEHADKALTWIERQKRTDGDDYRHRRRLQSDSSGISREGKFREDNRHGPARDRVNAQLGVVFSIFAAQPELFIGQSISGRDVAFGYVADLEWSGTGAFRTHYLFDLRQPHPAFSAR